MSKNTRATETSITPDAGLTEARQALDAHLAACHQALQQAGLTPPTWPPIDDATLAQLAAETFGHDRWLLRFDPDTLQAQVSPVPGNAFVLSAEQFKDNLHEVLPGYRLLDRPQYEQLTAAPARKTLLNVDFSHQFSRLDHGGSLEKELIETLDNLRRELSGLFGTLSQLLKTTEPDKVFACVADGILQELAHFDAVLDADKIRPLTAERLGQLKASLDDLFELSWALVEGMVEFEKDKFCSTLIGIADSKLYDIRALLEAYTQQTQAKEVADETGAA